MENKMKIVVLAKSYKTGGRCLAGKIVEYTEGDQKVKIGNWVRPVPNDGEDHSSLSHEMYIDSDGNEVKVLDIVEIPLVANPSTDIIGQPENFIFDDTKKWKILSSLRAESVPNITDSTNDIWLEPNSPSNSVSSFYAQQGLIGQSLYLIKPSNFNVVLSNEYNDYEQKYKKRITAQFDYNGQEYDEISITCPSTRRILTNQYPNEGAESVTMPLKKGDDYILCISIGLGIGNENRHLKFVATVFDYDGYLQREYAV